MAPPPLIPQRGRRRPVAALTLAAALLVAPLAAAAGPAGAPGSGTAQPGPADWATEKLAAMTLEEKVGQLFVTYVYGDRADTTDPEDVARNQEWLGADNGQEAVDRYHLGGVIYFTWADNLAGPAQIATLSNGLQDASLAQPSGVPLLITTDQEHGAITRMTGPATRFPGAMALGASASARDAYTAGRIAGRELRAAGITMNHAPVADVNVNAANPVIGVRAFSDDPGLTAELVAAQVAGYQSGAAGVAASAKHFPGHGNTDVDSHHDLPVITHTLDEWRAIDAPPFAAAIEAGAASIMSGHLQFPELDASGDPATLSAPIMTGLLREELGYDGVVITDSLLMEGVRALYPDAEVPVRALRAGVDLLLMPPDLDEAYHAVLAAVADGELTEERVDTSVRRVLELKASQGVPERPHVDPDRAERLIGHPGQVRRAQQLTDRTVTLVANGDAALPLTADGQRVLVTGVPDGAVETLAERVGSRDVAATAFPVPGGADPDAEAIAEVVAEAEARDVVLVATRDARGNAGQAALVEALRDTGKPVVTLAVDVPYDIAAYPAAETHLALYSVVPGALESAARVIFGEVDPTGALPVTVPYTDDPERVLFPLGHSLRYER